MKLTEKFNKVYERVLEKLKFFINKDNFTKIKAVLVCVLAGMLSVACEYTYFRRVYPEYISNTNDHNRYIIANNINQLI